MREIEVDKKYLKVLNDINQVAKKYYKNYIVLDNATHISFNSELDIKKPHLFKNSFMYCNNLNQIFSDSYIDGENISKAIRDKYTKIIRTDKDIFMYNAGEEPLKVARLLTESDFTLLKANSIWNNTTDEFKIKKLYGEYEFDENIIQRLLNYEQIYETIGFDENKNPIHMILTIQLIPAIKKLHTAKIFIGDPTVVNSGKIYKIIIACGNDEFNTVSKHNIVYLD